MNWTQHLMACTIGLGAVLAHADTPGAAQALRQAGLDAARSAVWVGPVPKPGQALAASLAHRSGTEMNPASVMKLVTTAVALDTLGPAFTWTNRIDGLGRLDPATKAWRGDLIFRGGGDPKLVVERLEPLLRALREQGIDHISGDWLIDRRAFTVPERDPGEFDGEPLRPYNVRPDPALINFKAVVLNFKPNPAAHSTEVTFEPPLAGVQVPTSVRQSSGGCGDWRAMLGADFSDPQAIRFAGSYPASCGERPWPVAYVDAASHSARALAGMWAKVGGSLGGQVKNVANTEPKLSQGAQALVAHASLPLAEVVRDVNKFSNNVMAQHVFLALPKSLSSPRTVQLDDARATLRRWWQAKLPGTKPPVADNGSGLSRQERVSAQSLAELLAFMKRSEHAATYFDSLPNAGVDGTLSALRGSGMQGFAQLKTGSLRDVTSLGGSFTNAQGEQQLFVAIYNGPNPTQARNAMYCLLQRQAIGAGRSAQGRNLCR